MTDKKFIKKEISNLHWWLLTTSKILMGVGIGIAIATYFWYAQPYWFLLILMGAGILLLTLYNLTKVEEKEEMKLIKKLKK